MMVGTEHKGECQDTRLEMQADDGEGVQVSFSCQWEPLKGSARTVMQSDGWFERVTVVMQSVKMRRSICWRQGKSTRFLQKFTLKNPINSLSTLCTLCIWQAFNQISKLHMKFSHNKYLCIPFIQFKQFKVLKDDKGYSLIKKETELFSVYF